MSVAHVTDEALAWLRARDVATGDRVAVALRPEVGVGLAVADGRRGFVGADPAALIDRLEHHLSPRWVWWDRSTADVLAERGVEIHRCWDVVCVHRMLTGGWRTSVALCWAWLHGLDPEGIPNMGQLDLLADREEVAGDESSPVRPDGHLRPDWVHGGWAADVDRLAEWAAQALAASSLQHAALGERPRPDRARSAANAESAAEFLCAELEVHGLPVDVAEALRIIEAAVGSRPVGEAEVEAVRAERDAAVLAHLDPGPPVDLRNPADVKAMLRRVAVDVPDTRAWRLEQHRATHPVVPALLEWRKAERIATTYGHRWLDEHVRDGRLRGQWSSSDGAAGRMTATAGLHNLPAEMRPAVVAEPGHVFVRADLGQIEPRVLAAVSGDDALATATQDDDLYLPVASRLGVSREIAKVAVLGAMYGATTGASAHALRGLEREYPEAMAFLERAAEAGRRGEAVVTFGGRLVPMWDDDGDGDLERARNRAAARGRFARNAIVQGSAAEFFKVWAVLVRGRGRPLDARIALCLHDELLVHVPEAHATDALAMVLDAVDEAAFRWSPTRSVRFVADATVIERWSDAKS